MWRACGVVGAHGHGGASGTEVVVEVDHLKAGGGEAGMVVVSPERRLQHEVAAFLSGGEYDDDGKAAWRAQQRDELARYVLTTTTTGGGGGRGRGRGKGPLEQLARQRRSELEAQRRAAPTFAFAEELAVAEHLYGSGKLEQALELLDATMAEMEKALGQSQASEEAGLGAPHARALRLRGRVRCAFGQPEEGLRALQLAAEALEQELGPRHAEVADAIDEVGRALMAQRRWDEAEALHLRVGALRHAQLGRGALALVMDARRKAGAVCEAREVHEMGHEDALAAAHRRECDPRTLALRRAKRSSEYFVALLLCDPESTGVRRLKAAAKNEGSKRPLAFWLAAETFRHSEPGTAAFTRLLRAIYRRYVKSVSSLACLPSSVRNSLLEVMQAGARPPTLDLFAEAQRIVFDMLFDGLFQRFMDSEGGQAWMKTFRDGVGGGGVGGGGGGGGGGGASSDGTDGD